jgi:hypothetical protein
MTLRLALLYLCLLGLCLGQACTGTTQTVTIPDFTFDGLGDTQLNLLTLDQIQNKVNFPSNIRISYVYGPPRPGTFYKINATISYANLPCGNDPSISFTNFVTGSGSSSWTATCLNCVSTGCGTLGNSVGASNPTGTSQAGSGPSPATSGGVTSPTPAPGPTATTEPATGVDAGDNGGADFRSTAVIAVVATALGGNRETVATLTALALLSGCEAQTGSPCMDVTIYVDPPASWACTIGSSRNCADPSLVGVSGQLTQLCLDAGGVGVWSSCGANSCAAGYTLNTTTRRCQECSQGTTAPCNIQYGSGGIKQCDNLGLYGACSCSPALGASCTCQSGYLLDVVNSECVTCVVGQSRNCTVPNGAGTQDCQCTAGGLCSYSTCQPVCCNFPYKLQLGSCTAADCPAQGGSPIVTLSTSTPSYTTTCAGGLPSGATAAVQTCSLADGAIPGQCQALPAGGTNLSDCQATACASGVPTNGVCTITTADNCTTTLCGGFNGCPRGQCTINATDRSAICAPCGADSTGYTCLGDGFTCDRNPCAPPSPCDALATCTPYFDAPTSSWLPSCACRSPYVGSGYAGGCIFIPSCGTANPTAYNSTCSDIGLSCRPTVGVAPANDYFACSNCTSCRCINASTGFRCVDVSGVPGVATGPACSALSNCGAATGNGYCLTEGVCVCNGNYRLPDCTVLGCVSNQYGECGVQDGRGTCDTSQNPPQCICSAGYTDPAGGCLQLDCGGVCQNNGTCDTSTGKCVCPAGYAGLTCAERCCLASGGCANSGQCFTDPLPPYSAKCACPSGWEGSCCELKVTNCPGDNPPGSCGANGVCNDTVIPNYCQCNAGWLGSGCQVDNTCTPSAPIYTVSSYSPTSMCYGSFVPFLVRGTNLNTVTTIWFKSTGTPPDKDLVTTVYSSFKNATTIYIPALATASLIGPYEVHLRDSVACSDLTLGSFTVGTPIFPFFATPNSVLNSQPIQVTLWVSGLVAIPEQITLTCSGTTLNYYSTTAPGCPTCTGCPCKSDTVPCNSCIGTTGQIYVTGTEYNFPKITIPAGLAPGPCTVTVFPGGTCASSPGNIITITSTLGIRVDRVDPPYIRNTINNGILIQGAGFKPGATVLLTPLTAGNGESTLLRASAFLSVNTLQTVIPAGTPTGEYALYISNLDGTTGICSPATTSPGQTPCKVVVVCSEPPVIDAIVPGYLDTSGSQSGVINTLYGTGFACCSTTSCSSSEGCCTGVGITQTCTCTRKAVVSVECKNWIDGSLFNRVVPATSVTARSPRIYDVALCGACISQDFVCVVRITNPDGSYFDFSSVVTRLPSAKLNKWRSFSDPTAVGYNPNAIVKLNIARRGAIGASAKVTSANAFVYAIGGDTGYLGGAMDTLEGLSLDKFGGGQAVTVLPFRLPRRLTFGAVSRIGRFLYYSGGWDAGLNCASDKVYRGEVLDPTKTPDPFLEVTFKDQQLTGGGGSAWTPGVYFYRVAALFAPDDQNNPGGESLPGYLLSLSLTAEALSSAGGSTASIKLTWDAIPDAIGYRIYRSIDPLQPSTATALPYLWAIADVGNTTQFEDKSSTVKVYPTSLAAWPRGFDNCNPQDPRCCMCGSATCTIVPGVPCLPANWQPGWLPALPLGSTGVWHEIPGHFRMHTPRWGHASMSSPSHLGSTDGNYSTNQWYLTVLGGRDCRPGSYPGQTTCPSQPYLGCGKLVPTYEALRVDIIPDPPTTKIRQFQNTGVQSSKVCMSSACNHDWMSDAQGQGRCCKCLTGSLERHCGFHDLSGIYDASGNKPLTQALGSGPTAQWVQCPPVVCTDAAFIDQASCIKFPGCQWCGQGGGSCQFLNGTCNSPVRLYASCSAPGAGTLASGVFNCPAWDASNYPNAFPKCLPSDGQQGRCCPWSEPFSTLLEMNLGVTVSGGAIDSDGSGGGGAYFPYHYPGFNEGQYAENNGRFLFGGTRVGFNDLPGVRYLDSIHVLGPGYANIQSGGKGITNLWLAAYTDPASPYHPAQYQVNFDPTYTRCSEYSRNRNENKQSCGTNVGCIWGGSNDCTPDPTNQYNAIHSFWQNRLESSAQNYGYCNFQAFGIIHDIGGIDGSSPFPGKADSAAGILPQVLLAEGTLLPNPGLCCTDTACNLNKLQVVLTCSNFAGEPRDSAWSLAFQACARENALFFMLGGMLDTQRTPTDQIYRTTN